MKLGVLAETARIMTGYSISIDVLLEGETVKNAGFAPPLGL